MDSSSHAFRDRLGIEPDAKPDFELLPDGSLWVRVLARFGKPLRLAPSGKQESGAGTLERPG